MLCSITIAKTDWIETGARNGVLIEQKFSLHEEFGTNKLWKDGVELWKCNFRSFAKSKCESKPKPGVVEETRNKQEINEINENEV